MTELYIKKAKAKAEAKVRKKFMSYISLYSYLSIFILFSGNHLYYNETIS